MKPSVSKSTFSSLVKLSGAHVRDQPFGGRGSTVSLAVVCGSSRTKGRAGKRQQELRSAAAWMFCGSTVSSNHQACDFSQSCFSAAAVGAEPRWSRSRRAGGEA